MITIRLSTGSNSKVEIQIFKDFRKKTHASGYYDSVMQTSKMNNKDELYRYLARHVVRKIHGCIWRLW